MTSNVCRMSDDELEKILGGIKHDNQKLRLDLLPFDALQAEAEVFTFGSTKYGDRNWEKGFKWMRIVGATLRHLFSYILGQDKDPETGKLHLAHCACCIHMLLAFQLRSIGEDDRVKSK